MINTSIEKKENKLCLTPNLIEGGLTPPLNQPYFELITMPEITTITINKENKRRFDKVKIWVSENKNKFCNSDQTFNQMLLLIEKKLETSRSEVTL